MQTAKLDDDFFINMKVVTESNGGLSGYEKLRNEMSNEKGDINGLLAQIDTKITQTKKDDANFINQLRAQKAEGIVEYVNFDVGNQDLVSNIIGIHQNYQQYQSMEEPIGPDYDRQKSWLSKFSDKSQDWNSYTKQTDANAYIAQHQTDIDAVIKGD